jgi:hypothetical protein
MKKVDIYLLNEMRNNSKSTDLKNIIGKTLTYSLCLDIYKKDLKESEKMEYLINYFKRESEKYCLNFNISPENETNSLEGKILSNISNNLMILAGKI